MSTFGRYFQGLTAYDLLGNLIPGLILVTGVYGALPVQIQQIGVVEAGALLTAAFIIGGFIQLHASEIKGDRASFDKTIKTTTKLSSRQNESGDHKSRQSTDGDEMGDNAPGSPPGCVERIAKSMAHRSYVSPIFDPLFGWAGEPRGQRLDDAVLTGRIRQHLLDTHEIPTDFDDFQVLYHLMTSRIDTADGPNRATRIQARRNLYRGVWIAMWWTGLLILLSTLLASCLEGWLTPFCPISRTIEYADWVYVSPNFHVWRSQTWQLLLPVMAVLYFSKWSYESQAEDFIEYLFTDYAVAISSETEDIPTDLQHDISHRIVDAGGLNLSTENDDSETDDKD